MEAVDRLVAIEEIKALKARYFRTMDTKDWDAFAAVFAPDASMDVSGELGSGRDDGIVTGRAEIAAFVRASVDAARCRATATTTRPTRRSTATG